MRAFVNPFFISRIVNRVALSSSKRKPVSDRHLDASILEDRVLYSVTPLDTSALVGDLDGIDPEMFDQPTFDACDADDVFSIDEAVDTGRNGEPPTSANGLLEVELLDTDQHLETVDLYGNEYHAMTDLPTLEVDVTYDSTDLLSALDGPAPLTDTFLLHSNPGAAHTIYLDFNGHVTSGTSWNGSFNGGADITTAAYDFDGNTASFSDAELERIQYIWQRVSEDFSPFDVNVTTEAPTLDALIKSGSGDTDWGVRVVIGGSSSDWYGASAGGVAYYNSFNWNTDTPVFVFEAQLGNGAEKYTAEAVSHEVGHSLGLAHDGTSGTTYYAGHGSGGTGWAPILGNSYYKNLTQWSQGEYAGATNLQDDLAIITGNNGFDYRVDDHGDSLLNATLLTLDGSLVTANGIIETNTDTDVFAFSTDAGTVQFQIDPFVRGPNLDILAELYDASHQLVAFDNPASYLDATIEATLASGMYYLHVSGTGMGDPLNGGYSDYGSLGQYSISGSIVPTNDDFVSISGGGQQLEGDAGSTVFEFAVTRSGNTSLATSVDYVINPGSLDANDFVNGIPASGTVSFAAGETTKMIQVEVAGDLDVEGDEAFSVALLNPEGNTQIASAQADGVVVNDDIPASAGILVTPTSGLTVKESGTTDSFTVVLASRPIDDVTIQVVSLNTAEGTVSTGSLTFSSDNWNVSQTVTVTGVDDSVRDGHTEFTIQLSTAHSNDAAYNGLDADDVLVTNQDDEKGGKPGGGGSDGGGGGGGGKGGGPKKAPIVGDLAAVADVNAYGDAQRPSHGWGLRDFTSIQRYVADVRDMDGHEGILDRLQFERNRMAHDVSHEGEADDDADRTSAFVPAQNAHDSI